MSISPRRRSLCLAGLASLLASPAVMAQSYPARPVQVIVPFAAGGPLDIVARAVLDKLSASLKQPFVVVNQTGAGGNIGNKAVASASPDGHSLLFTLDTTLTSNPAMYGDKLGYNTALLRPVSTVAAFAQTLVVGPNVKANTFAEFAALAKGGRLTYASGGNGNPGHLAMELLADLLGANMTHVPYRGAAPAVADLLSGQVDCGFIVTQSIVQHVRTGKLRALLFSGERRSPLLAQVPTAAEVGLPQAALEFSFVLMAPSATPDDIVARLNAEVKKAVQHPDLLKLAEANDLVLVADTPKAAAARLDASSKKLSQIITTRGIRPS